MACFNNISNPIVKNLPFPGVAQVQENRRIQGAPPTHVLPPTHWDPILSFSHTFLLKADRVGPQRPTQTGNPRFAPDELNCLAFKEIQASPQLNAE